MAPRMPQPIAFALLLALLAPWPPAGADTGSDGVTLRLAPALGPRMAKPGAVQSWACPPGLVRSGSECKALAVPPNATLHSSGRIWICNRGFRRAGGACQEVRVPEHASLDEQGTGWICNYGYARAGLGCAKRK